MAADNATKDAASFVQFTCCTLISTEALLPYMGYPQQHFANPPPPVYLSLVEPQPLPVSLPPSSSLPTRTLLLSMVPIDISESTVRRELEVFDDVRAVQMEWLRKGMAYPFNAYPHSSTSSTGAEADYQKISHVSAEYNKYPYQGLSAAVGNSRANASVRMCPSLKLA
ncbi:protein terminal ear1-like [Forsythia ovata]|uniref:Protein terminal ear1-like n=1 Tax=Forsythia ovata TaxID=205694 RepID=A0ABD1VI68_9LAMI